MVVPAEAQIHAPDFTRTEGALEVQCCFASRLCRIDGVVLPLNQKAVKGIFHVGLLQRLSVQAFVLVSFSVNNHWPCSLQLRL